VEEQHEQPRMESELRQYFGSVGKEIVALHIQEYRNVPLVPHGLVNLLYLQVDVDLLVLLLQLLVEIVLLLLFLVLLLQVDVGRHVGSHTRLRYEFVPHHVTLVAREGLY
jgi:hypothetical protein